MTNIKETIKKVELSNKAESLIIKDLDLSNKAIGDEEVKVLAELLKNSNNLTHLNLSNNEIGDEGAIAIAEMLKVNGSLLFLCLFGNKIGKEGLKALAEALKVNESLKQIDLRINDPIYQEPFKMNEILRIIRYLEFNQGLKSFFLQEKSGEPFDLKDCLRNREGEIWAGSYQ